MRRRHRRIHWEYVIIAVAVLALIQTTLLGEAEILGARPDLLLIVVILCSIRTDWRSACLLGWSVGMVKDLFSGTPFGAYALLYMVAGLICSYVAESTFIEHPVTRAVLSLSLALGINLVCIFLLRPPAAHILAFMAKAAVSSLFAPVIVLLATPLAPLRARR